MPVPGSSTALTEADFDQLSWHDSPIYGFSIDNDVAQWKSDLVFDIDYIVEWLCSVGSRAQFKIGHAYVSSCHGSEGEY